MFVSPNFASEICDEPSLTVLRSSKKNLILRQVGKSGAKNLPKISGHWTFFFSVLRNLPDKILDYGDNRQMTNHEPRLLDSSFQIFVSNLPLLIASVWQRPNSISRRKLFASDRDLSDRHSVEEKFDWRNEKKYARTDRISHIIYPRSLKFETMSHLFHSVSREEERNL